MNLFLGLDGGGTKTAAVLLTDTGDELGRGCGGPCNIATCNDEQLRASVSEAHAAALEAAGLQSETRFGGVCAGVAGYSAKKRRAGFGLLLKELVPADLHRIEPDYKIAYWGATEGEPGIIVSAGTGAVVYGRNAAGQEYRVDGRGFLLGDRGSAFDVARLFLHQLTLKLDRGRDLDSLDQAVLRHIGAEDADDVVEWAYRPFEPAKIAAIATTIAASAVAGDPGAIGRIGGAGMTLRTAAESARSRLAMPHDAPLYLLGSLWAAGDPILRGFHRGMDQAPPPPLPNIGEPLHDPAYGAALLAIDTWRAASS